MAAIHPHFSYEDFRISSLNAKPHSPTDVTARYESIKRQKALQSIDGNDARHRRAKFLPPVELPHLYDRRIGGQRSGPWRHGIRCDEYNMGRLVNSTHRCGDPRGVIFRKR